MPPLVVLMSDGIVLYKKSMRGMHHDVFLVHAPKHAEEGLFPWHEAMEIDHTDRDGAHATRCVTRVEKVLCRAYEVVEIVPHGAREFFALSDHCSFPRSTFR